MQFRRINIYGLVLLSFVWLTSCTKDIVEVPQENDPVFKAEGMFGNDPFSIVAGDDDAYMYTMTSSENNVSIFSGEISNGTFSIRLGLYDGLLDKPSHVVEDDLMNVAPSFARSENEELLVLSKNTMLSLAQSQNINKIEWFVDGAWKATNEYVFYEPGIYNVCAEVYHVGNSSPYTMCDQVIVGYQRHVNCEIEFSVNQMGQMNAEIDAYGNTVDFVEWSFNGNSIGSSSSLLSQYQLPMSYGVLSAKVHFSGGFVRTKSVLVNGAYSQLAANDFTIFEEQSNTTVPYRDFNVRLDILKDGKYHTSMICDNTNSQITITGFEYFGKNDNGKDVYKVSAIISAMVKADGSIKSIPVNFSTTFGIEIP